MKELRRFGLVAVSVFFACAWGATTFAADETEVSCKTWVKSHIRGLEAGEKFVAEHPSSANASRAGLSKAEIKALQEHKTDCEVM